ncbi:MAG: tocopherol cyclase family protein [Oscillospiraceae bacterium]|nr:tocopherol cyclase family protein [Oscillospiraceae bacterium]
MSNHYFEGYYHKLQNNKNTIAFIPGISGGNAFIQVITNAQSYYFSYPKIEYQRIGNTVKISNCIFSEKGIIVDIQQDNIAISGRIKYTDLTPLKYDIMGFFKYFPMECRHGVLSMQHNLNGSVKINGKTADYNGGIGYIESDSGRSFPKSYTWVQCNDFVENNCSVFASIADIPFCGFNFTGCICIVHFNGVEHRLATYLGVRIIKCEQNKIILKQGKYLLVINIQDGGGQNLIAPRFGKMNREITESVSCNARFRFYIGGELLFDLKSGGVGFEWVGHEVDVDCKQN